MFSYTLQPLPRIVASSSSSMLEKTSPMPTRLLRRILRSQARMHQRTLASLPCTCSHITSRARRSFSSLSQRSYPAAAAASDAAATTQKDIPILTSLDRERLNRLRNVGISAHIDRCELGFEAVTDYAIALASLGHPVY